MPFEPGAGLLPGGVDPGNFGPKVPAVIGDFEVNQFVDDDVFHHKQGRHA